MKKIVELENKWKFYKYRAFMLYIFIVLLFIFLVCLGFFIKFQYERQSNKNIVSRNDSVTKNVRINNVSNDNQNKTTALVKAMPYSKNKINFVCRKVLVDKLVVRSKDSFKSTPLGYYVKDSIFCADENISNGLLKTPNGWISSVPKYSMQVQPNMFVDFGFYKYGNNISKPTKVAYKNKPVEEINVFDKEIKTSSNTNSDNSKQNIANLVTDTSSSNVGTISTNVKPIINITSEIITPEKNIDLLKNDFAKSNDYDVAMKIAQFYYDRKTYQDAIKWALNASNADSKDKQKVDSWIIYAKSLYAYGNKEEAVNVLEKYVSTTNSKYAKDVLNNMKKGII